jgi:hypothetical protein
MLIEIFHNATKKSFLSIVITFLFDCLVYSQTGKLLTQKEAEIIKSRIGNISMPVFKAYEYKDIGGVYDLFFCENRNTISDQDTLNTKIQAICYLNDHDHYIEKWKIVDRLDKPVDIQEDRELNIWFWSKYTSNSDIDKDGLIEPIVIYGTKTVEGYSRINIIIFYKGEKYSIKAQECDLDQCRTLKRSDKYGKLPEKIKLYLDKLLEKLRQEQGVILKNG